MAGPLLTWNALDPVSSVDERPTSLGSPASESVPGHPASSHRELETLYLIRRPEMIRFLVSFGVNTVEAEDIAQEAFLRGFDQCRKNKPIDNFFHWLLACARNLALNRIRHEKYELPAPAKRWQHWQESALRTTSTPETEFLEHEEYRLLTEAMSTLSALEQQCLVLRFQDVPFREIAVTLMISMRSAVYHTGTGIRKLRRRLAAATS